MAERMVATFLLLLFLLRSSSSSPADPPSPACDNGFTCPTPTGQFADPCTCRRYYTCTDGRSIKEFCPSGLFWDDPGKICKYQHEAICGPVAATATPPPDPAESRAPACNSTLCRLPFCQCYGANDVSPTSSSTDQQQQAKSAQFVLVTIDGAVNSNNFDYYQSLLSVTTPDVVRATFFIEHEYCDYYMVERLYSEGNEIALSSVASATSRGSNLQSANSSEWRKEMQTLKEILLKFANVHPEDILGVRAPGLKPGRNPQYDALVEEGLVWDSSVATATPSPKGPVFPYTLDYKIPHKCKFDNTCPTKAYPGIWEVPLNLHFIEEQTGGQCSYLDQCVFSHQSSDDVLAWLKEDFNRHYEGNRAPYMIPLHTNWFLVEHQFEGLKKFVQWSKEKEDVYYGTITELILWMSEEGKAAPTPLELPRKSPCSNPNSCELPHTESNGDKTIRYMRTCNTCPLSYPWLKAA